MIPDIAVALEKRLALLSPGISIAYENIDFKPVTGVPYQRVNLLVNDPVDHAVTMDVLEQRGIFQVMLCYPLGGGRSPAQRQAQFTANHFAPVQDLTFGTAKVEIRKTPKVGSGRRDEDRWCIPVTVWWHAFFVS